MSEHGIGLAINVFKKKLHTTPPFLNNNVDSNLSLFKYMWKMSFPMFVSIVNDIREVGRSKSERNIPLFLSWLWRANSEELKN
jgi:hypothetical protein